MTESCNNVIKRGDKASHQTPSLTSCLARERMGRVWGGGGRGDIVKRPELGGAVVRLCVCVCVTVISEWLEGSVKLKNPTPLWSP